MNKRACAVAACAVCSGIILNLATAQDASFSADVKVVNLFATVRDRDGKPVRDLKKGDFAVKESGKAQPIRYFTRETNLPLMIGLLVDTSRSMQAVFKPEREASNKFFEQVLRERDQAFVMTFDNKVTMLQEFTGSKETLAEALEKLAIPRRPATLLYDGVREGSVAMKKQNGRKAFILLSDGMDVKSESSLNTAIEWAQRSDTIIYSILFAHPPGMRRGRGGIIAGKIISGMEKRGAKAMERLAKETGGLYAKVTEDDPIEKIYARVEEDLRSQYSIGYTPGKDDGKAFRKIELTVKGKGMVARTREGYYPK